MRWAGILTGLGNLTGNYEKDKAQIVSVVDLPRTAGKGVLWYGSNRNEGVCVCVCFMGRAYVVHCPYEIKQEEMALIKIEESLTRL